MSRLPDMGDESNGISKKLNRPRSFHLRYLELCRSKNVDPLQEIRANNHENTVLDFFGDKVAITDWLLIQESLFNDQSLENISIRLRKNGSAIVEHIDTEKKAKMFKHKSVILTKFVFTGVIEAAVNCITYNKNLRTLNLEGLPLSSSMPLIAAGLDANESIKNLSFERSYLGDQGCEVICNGVKYLMNIQKLNLAECGITEKGAEHVANMINVQKIHGYSESWLQSLRYRAVAPEAIPGLRVISLSHNPEIGDNGVLTILDALKEDCWITTIDMQNCGITDRAGHKILDCLESNPCISDFNIRNNSKLSKFVQSNIRVHFGRDDEEQKDGDSSNGKQKIKETAPQLLNRIKKARADLDFERIMRSRTEQLNKNLTDQLIAFKQKLEDKATIAKGEMPEGFVLVDNNALQNLINERRDFEERVSELQAILNLKKQSDQELSDDEFGQTTVRVNPISAQRDSPRNVLRVRRVKSERKYIEAQKETSKKKQSKSDHGLANEIDFNLTTVKFETNIGDSIAIGSLSNQTTACTDNYENTYNDNDLNESEESEESEESSSGSSTLRGPSETDLKLRDLYLNEAMKAFGRQAYRRSISPSVDRQYGHGDGRGDEFDDDGTDEREKRCFDNCGDVRRRYAGYRERRAKQSPRSLFLGLNKN